MTPLTNIMDVPVEMPQKNLLLMKHFLDWQAILLWMCLQFQIDMSWLRFIVTYQLLKLILGLPPHVSNTHPLL